MSSFCLPSGNLFSRVVVPCSLFKKVLLLVDLLFKQLPRNNYPTVCSLPLEGLSARATSGSRGAVQERGRGRRSRLSSFVHHRPSERERERTQSAPKLESEGRGFRRERGFAMGWKCAWIRRGLVVRRTPSSPALRYHGLQRAVAPPRGGGERRKGWVGSSWLRSEKEFFSSSSAM